jgi:peptidoglycan/xylan/chitin deacetylase (PgdA/CDA1 family)
LLRLSAILIALCLATSGCGIILRTPASPVAPTAPVVAAIPADPVKSRPNPVLPPVSTDPLVLPEGQTVVSITFDDGRISNKAAAQMLTAHGLSGTFFINSGNIGKPGYLSLPDVDAMALSGNEIGGHTVNHPDLDVFTADEVRRQVCDDRVTLLGWGFPVRSFAYPFGFTTPEVEQAVKDCGYNSARSLGELWGPRPAANLPPELTCRSCDTAETLPPPDPWHTQAPAQVTHDWTVDDFQQQINAAVSRGDGWVQLTFHGLCPSDCSDITTPQTPQFDVFLAWLADQQAQGRVIVRTVGDVIGGPVAPPVPGPAPTTTVVNPGLDAQEDGVPSCWMRASFGNNSPEFSLIPTKRGPTAERLVMRNYVDGDAKLLPTMDLGECAPEVSPGQTYAVQAWYTSTVPTSFVVQYRLARGVWVYGVASPKFEPATEFTLARWTLPPIPQGVTAISFGLNLTQDGELVTDDYSLITEGSHP